MTGYESIMLLCAVGNFMFSIASFVLDLVKALDKKDNKSE